MRKILITLLIGLAALACNVQSAAAADNWAMFRHDLKHTGRSPYIGAQNPNLGWACALGDAVRNSSPSIAPDGTIYIGANDGNIYAVNPGGTIEWSYPIGGNVYSSPAIDTDGTIYIGSWREAGYSTGAVYAINPDGTLKWRYPSTGYILDIESSPAIDPVSGVIYVGGYCQTPHDGELYAINPDGTLECTFTPHESGWMPASPAIRGDGKIIIGDYTNPSGIMRAINPEDCTEYDMVYVGGDIYSSAAIDSVRERIYFGNSIDTGSNLWAYDFNLEYVWGFDTGGFVPGSPAIGSDGTIYVGSYDNKLYAVNPDRTEKWHYTTGGDIFSSPAVGADGTIYVGSLDNKVYAIDSTGTLKWSYTTGGPVYSSPAIGSDGTIYVGSMDGFLYAIEPPCCHVSLPVLDFKAVSVGDYSDTSITIKNLDCGDYISGIVSESCDHFSIVPLGENPYNLAPGESLVVLVYFEPTSEGTHICTIETGNDLCCDVQCTGIGYIERIPSPDSSTVEPWGDYFHVFVCPGTGWTEFDNVTVTVRDDGGYPCVYTWVEIDVSDCSDLCIDSPDGLSGITDEYGKVYLDPRVGGCDDCAIIVRANGIDIRTYSRINSADWDGSWADGVVDGADSLYFANHYNTTDACADYNGDGFVDLLDFAILVECYGASNTETCPYSCDVVPASIGFDTVTVGSSKDTTFTIRNTGEKTLSGTVSEAFDPFSYYSIVSGGGSYSITSGDSLVVTVHFEPGAVGIFPYTAETGDSVCSDFTWLGVGVEAPSMCEVTPDSIDFGMVMVGSWKDTTFTIKNTGGGTLDGSVSESCPYDSIVSGDGPYSIPGGDSLVVTMRFEPADTGTYVCTVETGDALCSDVYSVGYGIDTIPPPPPTGLSVAYNTGSGNQLMWRSSEAEDFDHFNIYRSDNPDLLLPQPVDTTWGVIHSTSDTTWMDAVSGGWRYRYQLTALDYVGNESDATVPIEITGHEVPQVPKSFTLYQNVPNPFNPTTTIRFDLPRAIHVKLSVYNVKGELVVTIVDRHMTEGCKEVSWTARDERGRSVASGIYFYRLVAGDFVQTKKMVLLR